MTADAASDSGEPFSFGAGPFTAGELRVTSFVGREEQDHPFSFDVTVAFSGAEDEVAFEEAVLGERAWLRFEMAGSPRVLGGTVVRVATVGAHTLGRSFRVRLAADLRRLEKRRTTRIFQDLTLIDIASAVLGEHRVAHRFALARDYPRRSYCVQYRETDLAFVTRLLAEEGISFYFADGGESASLGSTMVIVDDATLAPAIPGSPELVYRLESPGTPPREHHVLAFSHERRLETAKARLRDYDFHRPLMELTGSASASERLSPGVELEDYEHHGGFEESDARDEEATMILEQLRRRARVAEGRSPCRRLAPGHRFTLTEHDATPLNGEYRLTRVDHHGFGSGAAPAGQLPYQATFIAVPSATAPRPKRPKRVLHQVVESATVSGPPEQEIYVDEHGRIRVQFHWDPEADPAHSSCWMRVVQAWSGEGWGSQFIPRIGMEVLVTFLGGDPDRPVILGCLPNATHPVPFPLPGSAAKSGVRTRSTPGGGGYNEISFDDSAGAEVLNVRAQKDYTEETTERRSSIVGADRAANVGGADTLNVLGNRTVAIGGDLREEIDGDAARFVMGSTTHEFFGNRDVIAYAHDRKKVDGSLIHTVRGDGVTTIGGHATITVGTEDMGEAQAQVSGTLVLGATVGVRIVSDKSITLAVGDSTIVIDADGITLDAKVIRIKGTESVSAEGAGPSLSLAEHAEIVAKKVNIYAEEARIELEKDASVKGRKVLLNCDSTDPEAKSKEEESAKRKFTLSFKDPRGEPYADKHYRCAVAGKISEGATGADGGLSVEVPSDAKIAQIRLWIDDYPEGRTRDHAVDLVESLPDAGTVRGAKQRLKNLGYYDGKIDDDDGDLGPPLLRFQRDRDIPQSGKLDGATKSEIEKTHGH
jgi:type VI secretion system secreted protein VgrG